MFMQEAGTYIINSGSLSVTARDFSGAFPVGTRDPLNNIDCISKPMVEPLSQIQRIQ
jgi:hypothetical protein